MVVSSMHALVINLDSGKERLEFQKRQLADLGLAFERIPALSAEQLDEGTYATYSNNWERPMRRSEVACTLSHIRAWKKVLNAGRPIMILEDDALLSIHTKLILESLVNQRDYDCVNLETRRKKKTLSLKKATLCESFQISELIQDRCGAAAYVLWPNGAAILINWVEEKGLGLADAILSTGPSWSHGQIEPAAVIQLDCCNHYGLTCPLETSTSIHNIPKPEPSSWYPFLWRRLRGQVRIAIKKLTHYRLSESVELRPFGFR